MTNRNEATFPNTASGKFTFYAAFSLIVALFVLITILGFEFLAIGLMMVFGEGVIASLLYLAIVIYFIFFEYQNLVKTVIAKAMQWASSAATAVSNFFNGSLFA